MRVSRLHTFIKKKKKKNYRNCSVAPCMECVLIIENILPLSIS